MKLGKAGKLLLSMGSMFVMIWVYSQWYGWAFALGLVLCILVHELGHVFVAWRRGLPVSAPIFIPGAGALILLKRNPGTAWEDALVGIGGPVFGTLAGLVCYGIYMVTGNPMFAAIALFTFLLNLFNMVPLYPLDGGRIVSAVSPYIWLLGVVLMAGLYLLRIASNPFIWVLIILSLPAMVSAFKRGTQGTLPWQRVTMGLSYVGLSTFLVLAVFISGISAREGLPPRDQHSSGQVAQRAPISLTAASTATSAHASNRSTTPCKMLSA